MKYSVHHGTVAITTVISDGTWVIISINCT